MMIKTALTAATLMTVATFAQAATFTFDAADGNGSGSQLIDGSTEFALSMVGTNVQIVDSVSGRTTFTATAAFDVDYDISWSFFSFDASGPSADPFGYFVGLNNTQISDDSGANFQSGQFTLSLSAGDNFGFYIDSGDDIWGASLANIVGTKAAVVPLPASGLLLLGALGVFGLRRRQLIAK